MTRAARWPSVYPSVSCNHYLCLVPRPVRHPQKETPYPLSRQPQFPFAPTAGNHSSMFYLRGFTCSGNPTGTTSHGLGPSLSGAFRDLVSSRFTHVAACVRTSFLLGGRVSQVQSYRILFMHSPVRGPLGCWQTSGLLFVTSYESREGR